jgi:small-conductance mechanosensitive channel
MSIKSQLAVGVNAALRDAKISIPFPQRDLHIQTIAPESLKNAVLEVKSKMDGSGSKSEE